MHTTISLSFKTPKDAKRILLAINPDNSPLPLGLEIECHAEDTKLIIEIQCERGITSLGSTIEDILSAIDLSIRTSDSLDTSKEN
jgi:hypothetical protein